MKLLAIETSSPEAGLAVLENGEVVAHADFSSDRAHNAVIFAPLAELLEAAGEGLDTIVLGTGPGSYSGVRVGIAVANGLSLARGIPVAGVSSLLALARAGTDYTVAGDARRGGFFLATIRGCALEGEIALLEHEPFVARVAVLEAAGENIWHRDALPPAGLDSIRAAKPDAAELGRQFFDMTPAERDAAIAAPLEPIYLRAPYITMPKGGMCSG
ncbi:MAG: tRNA (adenosine(37)-N6)-threonylcarbamoyltransferase complex dimerization subunit type 1 TsaB [Verrucomicrobiales bacterium]